MIILLEGMDKVGKSTVANHFCKKDSFEYIHMSAPTKGISREDYIKEMMTLVANTAGKNVVIDRTWYGELVWPFAYGRKALLDLDFCNTLTYLAKRIHKDNLFKIYMHDPDKEKHQARMREFKEPVYNYDLVSDLYEKVMIDSDFVFYTFQEAEAKGWTK